MTGLVLSFLIAVDIIGGMLDSPAVSVCRYAESSSVIEICSGVAVSPGHAVTLYAFTSNSDVFVVNNGVRIYPDSIVNFRDMGLSMLVFSDSIFTAYEQPRNTTPPNGAALMIMANHPTGFSAVRTFPLEQLDDGALLLASAPSPVLMGAPAFDSYNVLAGVVTGSFDPGDGRGELMALVPCNLWYFWVQRVLTDAGMSTPPFGVTAMPATSGLSSVQGILILDVEQNSLAQRSGIRQGDIVTEINGERVYHPEAMKVLVQSSPDELELSIIRDSLPVQLTIPER